MARRLFTAVILLLTSQSWGVPSARLCVHVDGTAALESTIEPCCEPGVPPGSPRLAFELETRECPGCRDVMVSSDGRPTSRSKASGPLELNAPFAAILSPSENPDSVWVLASARQPVASSPPQGRPLRI